MVIEDLNFKKQKHVLVLVWKVIFYIVLNFTIFDCSVYLRVVFINISVLNCGVYSRAAFNQISTVTLLIGCSIPLEGGGKEKFPSLLQAHQD